MNEQKRQDIVSHIDYLISELNHLKFKIKLEDGIHIYVLHQDDFTAIEIWDSDCLERRIVYQSNEKTPDEKLIPHLEFALNQLGIRAFKKQIFWESDFDWSKLRENFRKLDEVYKIQKSELSSTLKEEIKERLNALYSM